jgi:hypothetical protein
MDITPHSTSEGGKMQNSQGFQRDAAAWLDVVGGEPLAGSGFEAEEPDPGFSSNEQAIQE